MNFGSWGRDLLDLLVPPGCAACRAWLPGGRGPSPVCGPCRSRLRPASWPRCARCHFPLAAGRAEASECAECRVWSPALSSARFAYVLAPPASDLVHALKYEGWGYLAEFMGGALADLADPAGSRNAAPRGRIVVPVPTSPARIRRRGYNQAELLAGQVAGAWGGRVARAIARTRESRSQTSLAPAERRDNVRGAFTAVRSEASHIVGEEVTLVDDVLTTGATASEAAEVLSAMGAVRVTLIAFARALPGDPRRRP